MPEPSFRLHSLREILRAKHGPQTDARCPRIANSSTSQARASLVTVHDAAAREIVRRKLHRDAISGKNANEVLAHLSRNVGQHLMLVFELDAKHRVRQRLDDSRHHFDGVFLATFARLLLVWFRPS